MDTKELRQQANALGVLAQKSLEEGDVESTVRMTEEAQAMMAKADQADAAANNLKALQGDFNRPMNEIPVTSSDVSVYDPNDTTSRLKMDYKPASYIKGLPAMAQPLWVQEQMGKTSKTKPGL